jgi:hypothetical protein
MGLSRDYACGGELLSERKRATFWQGDTYYDQLLSLAESLPTKMPPEESAEDSQLGELMDALRAANLEDNDIPLFTLLMGRGFGKVETYLLISLMVRRKKGQGRPSRHSILKLQAVALHEIKKQLRASGTRSRVHEKAIKLLEKGHNLCCEDALAEWGLTLPNFDRDKLENHFRRSSKPRKSSTKSRAK